MGILERLNRTLKWDFVFWHEFETIEALKKLDQPFKDWYNLRGKIRKHPSANHLKGFSPSTSSAFIRLSTIKPPGTNSLRMLGSLILWAEMLGHYRMSK
jgi:hypothetical protein